eukprot:s177_g9.t1
MGPCTAGRGVTPGQQQSRVFMARATAIDAYDYSAWDRPLGFPSGITFGPQFIQIGKWRMGQIDEQHFSIAHQD